MKDVNRCCARGANGHQTHAKTLNVAQKRKGKLRGNQVEVAQCALLGKLWGSPRTHWGGNFTYSSKSETGCALWPSNPTSGDL